MHSAPLLTSINVGGAEMRTGRSYQSSFTPTRATRGGTMLSGRRKDDPDDQLVFAPDWR